MNLGKKGQTAIEYILLMAAVMAIIVPLLSYISSQLMPERNPCPEADRSFGCQLQRFVGSLGAQQNFKYFILRR